MSFFELLIIAVVGILLLKPEDLPGIARQVKELRVLITKVKTEFLKQFELEPQSAPNIEEVEKINFYLKEISQLAGSYEGEYSLKAIKEHYQQLVRQQIAREREESPKQTMSVEDQEWLSQLLRM